MNRLKYLLTLFVFCLLSLNATSQITDAPEQNCIGGIPVCQPTYAQANAYSGDGTITELNVASSGCLGSQEKNDVWYIINVAVSGTLAFTITPVDLTDDYDFGVWDITGGGCSLIYNYGTNTFNNYPPIACNYSGLPGQTGLTTTPPSGQWSPTINVTAGQTLALNVSDFSSSQSGYLLDFSASTAVIFDTVKPVFQNVAVSCSNSDSLIVTMSKPIQCSSLDADGSNLYITPAGSTTIVATASPQCQVATGNATTTYTVKLSSALPLGTYQLHAQNGGDGNTVLSACGLAQSTDDAITFNVLNAPLITISPANPVMCVNGSLQLNVSVTNPDPGITYTYAWTPNQHIDDSTSAHPVVSPILNTTYNVVVLENGASVCNGTASTLVKVLQGFDLPTKDTSICAGASFQVRNTGDTNYTYHWAPATGLSDPNIMTPIASPVNTVTYTVTASYPGCADSSESLNVSVGVTPIINAGPDTTTCIGDSLQMHVDIANMSPTYAIAWAPNRYITDSTSQDPKISPVTTTNYVVTVTDNANTKHCSSSDTVKVTVLQDIELQNHDTAICRGATVQLTVTGDPRYHILWTPSTWLSDPAISTPVSTPDSSISYTVTASYPGCTDKTRSINIDVQPNPVVIAGPDVAKCEWDTVMLHGIVTPAYAGYTYDWSPGKDLFDSTVINPIFSGDSTTVLHFIVTTPAGCRGEDSAVATVWQGRYGTVSNDTGICPGDNASLVATGGVSYSWTPTLGISDPTIPNPLANPPATTRYTVYMLDTHNCADTNSVTVTVHPAAVIDMPDSVTIYPGETYQIEPQTNCVSFEWFPPLGLSSTTIANPVAAPDVNTRYKVNAATEWGCKIVDSIDVYADPGSLIALPNAFTPGNGPNNIFKILKRGIATLQTFRVYNRWGTLVFQTTNIEDGWDGTFNGEPQPTGVYVYMVEATSSTGQHFAKNGNVTLLR